MDKEIILTSPENLRVLIAETLRTELSSYFSKDEQSDDRLLTRKQVAERLGISLPTLNLWTKEGIVPAVRLNSSVRYRMADVEAAMQDVKSVKYMRGRTINNLPL
jgi:excisionase family DNA binding protein